MYLPVRLHPYTIADTRRTSPFTRRRLEDHLWGPASSAKLDLKKLGPDLDLVDAAHLALFPAVPASHIGLRTGVRSIPRDSAIPVPLGE